MTRLRRSSGVTLIEMLIVVSIIAIVAGVSFPAIASGLSGLRLTTASGTVATFLTSTMNRVDRREEAAAMTILPQENRLLVFTAASGEKPARTLEMPPGIRIEGEPRRYLFQPGGATPRVTVILRNDRGARRSIRVDPATAVPDIRRVEEQAK